MMNVPLPVNAELLYMIAPDGEIFEFAKDNSLEAYANFGTAAFNFVTSKAYRQDGSSFIDAFAEERLITIDYREICETRQQWWDRRRELQAYFRPNRGGVFQFVVQQPDRIFSLRVIPDPGMEFAGSDVTSLTIQETVRLRAFDPFWIAGDVDPTVFESITAEDLIFPITFPITFGAAGTRYSTGNLEYAGTAKTYPVLTITGPYAVVTLTVLPQNKSIRLSVEIPEGETRIIDPNPSNPSIVDLDGVSHFNELDLTSDPLQEFVILPEPPGNNQSIQAVFIGGTGGVTSVAVQFETKYVGI